MRVAAVRRRRRSRCATGGGSWRAANVVIATGWCDRPRDPGDGASASRPRSRQVTPSSYRNPASVPDGGVLVVGASATGVQLADELRTRRPRRRARRRRPQPPAPPLPRDGHLLVARPHRHPRQDDRRDARSGPRPATNRRSSSSAGPTAASVDLATLQDAGRAAHRARSPASTATTSTSPTTSLATTAAADQRMRRVLADIDAHIDDSGLTAEVLAPEPIAPVRPAAALRRLDLRDRRHHDRRVGHRVPPQLPVAPRARPRRAGEIRHRRGVTPLPGLYVLGQRFQHRRNSELHRRRRPRRHLRRRPPHPPRRVRHPPC